MRRRWMLYFGWAGVGLFFYVIVATAIPDHDYFSAGENAPNFVAGDYALGRLLLLLGAGISLAVCFRSWAKMLKSAAEESPATQSNAQSH